MYEIIETNLRTIITLCLLSFVAGIWSYYQYTILCKSLEKFGEKDKNE